MFYRVFLCMLMLASMCGCQNKQSSGTLFGALTGAALGAAVGKGDGLAVGIGAVAGAMIGNEIGRVLDEKDKAMMMQSSNQALEKAPSGHKVEWSNPDSGHRGYTVVEKTYQKNDGRYCREYSQKVYIGNKEHNAYGTACRQPDGSWEIQN